MLTNLTIVLITLLVTYTGLTHVALRIQRARKAKQMGATLPPRINNGILGWYGLWLVIQNARSMKLPHNLGKRFANGPTWLTPVAGNEPINTIDPENVKAILATQFKDFCLGIRHRALSPSIGDGIFTLDGEGWTHSRALLRPQFSRQQISRVHSLERLMQILFKLIRKENGEFFDLQNLFFMFTLDSATEFLYGASVDTLADLLGEPVEGDHGGVGEEVRKAYQQSINNAQDISAIRTRLQGLYWIAGNIYQRSLYQKSNKGVKDFSQFFVDKALNTPKEKLKEMEESDNYVFLYELVKSTRNPVIIRDQLINILVAGRDTTASLLSFTFYTLGRRPDVLKKLRAAILEDFGTSPDEITFESLKRCDYLRYVLNEVLRLYPSVPLNARSATRDTTLPRGGGPDGKQPVFVYKGQMVAYCVYWMHRDKKYWGEDALEFNPDRWDPKVQPQNKGWEYLPFNGGPRICLGQQFALTEAGYVVTRMLQEFDYVHCQNQKEEEHPPYALDLTMRHGEGVWVSMK
ncbi:Cytochrome P450 52A12 [Yarrowia sp. C11]|nr:Cytochrome P450 52A12 [Yarrowia sp. E02]KAG5372772.1 Cytochrome P450 52A12 [Yarrowia sp. C11]